MKALTNQSRMRWVQGFAVHVLANEEVELAVVPELGAKIISLKDLRTGREWLWHPPDGARLFKNDLRDDFSASPLVGIDECFPTIEPCFWQGRELPDHGEIWSMPWQLDAEAWENGILKTRVRLRISPFEFERTIELRGNNVFIGYKLHNLSTSEESFLWAMHPLLRLEAGDQLELPASTRELLNGEAWVDAVTSAIPDQSCAKIFARPVNEGWAAIHNRDKGDRLAFVWDSAENNTLGLWLTRGGWHGHHHLAIEPTNANDDSLAVTAARKHCGTVAGKSSTGWQLCIRVGLLS
jgi:galactose mutarotase-like enzyme